MKSGFYIKTAWNNIRKNYRFYIPQMLTGTGLLACLYIVFTLKSDKRIAEIRGGDYMPLFMSIGTVIISLLSVILILYTNSFLMRQRKREYGLYNVLGMEKRHIGKILFWETAVSGGISVFLGSGLGILFYKACSLLICNLFHSDIILGFDFITPKTVIPPAIFFVLLYLFAFFINRISIAKTKPVDLLKSRQFGEKEPKVKVLILILGVIFLGGGYVISLITKNPLSALLLFFVAVFAVIIGTYFLFTAGSIFVLKTLKRNKKFYYNKKHLPGVSGLLYRMKQNAVGLASICILATGVLVMISASVSLYSGMQETLDRNYPQDLYLSAFYGSESNEITTVPSEVLCKIVDECAEKNGVAVKSAVGQRYLEVAYLFDGKRFSASNDGYNIMQLTNAVFITSDMYHSLTGNTVSLQSGELGVTVMSGAGTKAIQPQSAVTLHGKTYSVRRIKDFPVVSNMDMVATSCYGIVVSDEDVLNEIDVAQKRDYGINASAIKERITVVFESRRAASAVGQPLQEDIFTAIEQYAAAQPNNPSGGYGVSLDSYWDAKEAVIGMYGTLLFLGIILGLVCLFATVLIIYYKQISEGYEDRERYQIMKKVGMSDGEIRQTIRTQTLLVFFLPLVFAGIHTAFAFPMVNRLLHLLLLSSTKLFVLCTLITFSVFALIYVAIYSLTAKTYYKIVR